MKQTGLVKQILLVEDEQPLIDAIKNKLEYGLYSVTVAKSAAEAFSALAKDPNIDAIWLDHYLLGKETGLDFITGIKTDGNKWKNIPVFVVSNTATPDKIHSYMRLGVTDYYTKADHRLDKIVDDITIFLGKNVN